MRVRLAFYAFDVDSGVALLQTTAVDGATLAAAVAAAKEELDRAVAGAAAVTPAAEDLA